MHEGNARKSSGTVVRRENEVRSDAVEQGRSRKLARTGASKISELCLKVKFMLSIPSRSPPHLALVLFQTNAMYLQFPKNR
jgi:hypothetical protein